MVNDSLSNRTKLELLYLLENFLKEKSILPIVNDELRIYNMTTPDVDQNFEAMLLGKQLDQDSEKYFLLALIYIVEQYLKKPELEFLSREFCMSKSTFYRRIKLITGLSPINFIRMMRMRKAQVLLLNRMLNISEVAYSLGFNNPKYFSSCFKKEFGVTPSEYQNKLISSYA